MTTSVTPDTRGRAAAHAGVRGRRPASTGRVRRTEVVVLGAAGIGVVLLAWVVTTALELQPPMLLPGPQAVWDDFVSMLGTDTFWKHLGTSGQELALGYALAVAAGIPLGLLVGWYRRLGYLINPLVSFLYSIPRIALSPLLIIWLGVGMTSKVALVFLMAVFPVLIATDNAMRNIDPHLIRTARCFGAGDAKIFRTIGLPATVPYVLSGLRLAVGQALIGVYVAELMGSQYGIGRMMADAGDQFKTATVFVGLLVFSLAGFLLTYLIGRVEKHFAGWRT